MTELFLNYRDVMLPAPFWEEQGVYGGYRWIALDDSDTVWISRKWEPYLVTYTELRQGTLKLNCHCECMKEFRDMMSDASVLLEHLPSYKNLDVKSSRELVTLAKTRKYVSEFLYPTEVQRDSSWKIENIIQRQRAVAIVGYNSKVDQAIQTYGITEVFSSSPIFGEPMQEADVVALSSHLKVIIPKEKYYLKEHVKNWANVITI